MTDETEEPWDCLHGRDGFGPYEDCLGTSCVLAIRAARPKPYRIYGNDGQPIVATLSVGEFD